MNNGYNIKKSYFILFWMKGRIKILINEKVFTIVCFKVAINFCWIFSNKIDNINSRQAFWTFLFDVFARSNWFWRLLNYNDDLLILHTLGAETFAGINFRVKKNAKYLTKTFTFGNFWNKFLRKNFREFKIREMLAASKKKKKHQVLL